MTAEEQAAADKAAADKAAAEKAAAEKLAADKAAADKADKEAADKAGAGSNGPVDTLVKDVARIKEKIGLDAPSTKKTAADDAGSLWCTRLFHE